MSFSEFTKADYEYIQKEYDLFYEIAKKRCTCDSEIELVEKAFDFANQAHRNVRRRSGEPYIIHPLNVAKIVISEIGLGCKSICAALLHDVVEDTNYTVEDIANLFGSKIASIVDGLTKIKTVLDNEDRKGMNTESLQAENFKRILLTLNDDIRIVLIKLADRLHNCRTIDSMPEHKRDKILSETMFIFIPLAHRLGLYGVKSELENIWLTYKEPEENQRISELLKKDIESRNADIDKFIEPIEKAISQAGYKFQIKKRIKTPYSIWHKMKTKKVPFEQIFDLYAIRIIYELPEDSSTSNAQLEKAIAYMLVSIVTSLYPENTTRRRDWINHPKNNGYEALHCTLMSPAGVWMEVQIRSKRMDDIAEKGIAAHWAYKEKGGEYNTSSEIEKLLSEIQEILTSKDLSSLELLDIIHQDLMSSEIVIFTPKGEQKSIVSGATALDFAYSIHSKVGEHSIAAKINMKLVPLSTVLKGGDLVEIITAESANPKIEWLQFVKTRHAKTKIIDYFRNDRMNIADKGEKIFNERLRSMGRENNEEHRRLFMNYCQIKDIDELYFRVGLGILGPEQFKTITNENTLLTGEKKKYVIKNNKSHIKYKFADTCCNPIPGDPLIGFMLDDKTIIVHTKSCPAAERLATRYGNRMVVPQWSDVDNKDHTIRLSLRGIDRVGLLHDLTSFISENMKINMRKLQLLTSNDLFEGYIEVMVSDKGIIDNMVIGLKKIDGITDVLRTDF